jgi:hypothetical protein
MKNAKENLSDDNTQYLNSYRLINYIDIIVSFFIFNMFMSVFGWFLSVITH